MRFDCNSGLSVLCRRAAVTRRAAQCLVVIALVAGMMLAACGRPPAGSGPITLVFKHAKVLGPTDPVGNLLRKFERLQPGIRLKSESLPWTTDEQHQYYSTTWSTWRTARRPSTSSCSM